MSEKFLLGLVGHPVSKSLSPAMHKAALAHCGLQGDYKLLDILPADLFTSVKRLKQLGITGFNVTIPHKTAILRNCEEHSRAVERVGAANTIKIREDGSMYADNTDIKGFANALNEVYNTTKRPDDKQKTACILGAGGAAKAGLEVLTSMPFDKIYVAARDTVKAEQLVHHWKSILHSKAQLVPVGFSNIATIHGAELFVSTIPYGLTVEIEHEFLSNLFSHGGTESPFIFDMVYSRHGSDTSLVNFAKKHHIDVCDGTGMLVYQALEAFHVWTGQKVAFDIMHSALVQERDANAADVKS